MKNKITIVLDSPETEIEKEYCLNENEKKFLTAFRKLNEEGQRKVLDYMDTLIASGKYAKQNKAERSKATPQQININIYL